MSGKRAREVTPYNSSGKSTVGRMGALIGTPVGQPQSYERTTRAKHEDKQTGSYESYTQKEKAVSGERHVERGTGQVGVKTEFKKSSTVKIGNKSGYTEYQFEERIRDVKFGGGSITNGPSYYDKDNDDDNEGNNYAPGEDYDDDNAAPSYDAYDGGYSDDDYY